MESTGKFNKAIVFCQYAMQTKKKDLKKKIK